MKFLEYCEYLEKFEGMNSRNEMVELLAVLLRELEVEEISPAIYMLQGKVAPLYKSIEFNFSSKSLIKAFQRQVGEQIDVAAIFAEVGDIGSIVEQVFGRTGKKESLDLGEVFTFLKKLALVEGKDSQKYKADMVIEMQAKMSLMEYKYFSRIVVGKLRLGLSDKTILEGISWSVGKDKSHKAAIEHAFGVNADLGYIATKVLSGGMDAIEGITIELGIPIASKLVEREKDSSTLFERLGQCIIQPKYDGLRLQIHFRKEGFSQDNDVSSPQGVMFESSGNIKVVMFSRNMSSMGFMFPDVAEVISKLDVDSIVIDTEVIGFDPQTNDLLPFQQTIQRKRKTGIEKISQQIPVRIYSFDILELNGESLLSKPLTQRLDILNKIVANHPSLHDRLVAADSPLIESAEELERVFMGYVNQGLEGIIAKQVESVYAPGTRNYDWIKLKAKSQKELVDSVDAVVLGYYKGRGARAKFGIGALLIGTLDRDGDKFVSLSKLGTGIKDEEWIKIRERLEQIRVQELPSDVVIPKHLLPDVLVSPEVVVTVEADEITKSSLHGDGNLEGSFSLRFPRLIDFDRDKDASQVTDTKQLGKLFELQYLSS